MSELITFEQVFTNRFFRIPDYQRGYSWGNEQLEQLWADLENIHYHLESFHFTGTLTVNNFESTDLDKLISEPPGYNIQDKKVRINDFDFQPIHLIDGQQRLTTLLILLSVLIDNLNNRFHKPETAQSLLQKYFRIPENGINKYIFGYEIDVPSHQYLIGEIFSDSQMLITEPETVYTNNLWKAKFFFTEKTEIFNLEKTETLILKITKRLLFSVLNLSQGEKKIDISMVFETLNFRGLGLSSLELFKNRLLYLISKQHTTTSVIRQSRNRINKSWLTIYEWLGKNKDNELRDNEFLKAFWLLYFSNSNMVAADFKAYQKSLFTDIFSLQNSENKYLNIDNLRKWLQTMSESVKLWFFIHNPYYFDENNADFEYTYTANIQRYLDKINKFPKGYGKYMQNLILAVFLRDLPKEAEINNSDTEKEKIKYIENILFAIERHNVICYLLYGNKTNFNQEKVFRDINFYFLYGNGVGNVNLLTSLNNERVSHFDWQIVTKHIHRDNRFYSWDGIHYILKEYEFYISKNYFNNNYTINLIYPDSSFNQIRREFYSINNLQLINRDKYTYSLGNIYISKNSRNPNDFNNLKKRIENTLTKGDFIFETEKELLNYNNWGMDDVKDRGKKIIDFMIKHWSLQPIHYQNILDDLLIN